MSSDSALLSLLACPRCDRSLEADVDSLRCPGCATGFPSLDGVPWLFADPDTALAEWRQRFDFALTDIAKDEQAAVAALEKGGLLASTERRLRRQIEAWRAHADELKSLLAPLGAGVSEATYETHLALRTRLPTEVGLTAYYANVHRDWAWGDEENRQSLEAVAGALRGEAPGRMLVPGAGAGRLAYDLHQTLAPEVTVALDFNPLLVLAAAKLCAGETVSLHEFPIAPSRAGDVAAARELAAPEPARPGLRHVLASALRPPFRAGAFDTLVTPWLVDVLPEDLSVQAARWNRLLTAGGRWVWFGSAAFRTPSPARNYSLEEALEIIAMAGFGEPSVTEREIPYMDSPLSRHGRREQVVTVVAEKTAEAELPPRHKALPDWLVVGSEPVPALENFRMQAVSTRVHAFIMSMIDGRRSIADMAKLMEEKRLMTRAEAEGAIRGFFIRMLEDSQRPPPL
ncbi:hypothetical protein [Lentisalinibacter salinarum]|uniref:hypothetical protein n=1 Tax=Lentisalinibacter salinarum TaxID=2992239 RepID=UPI003867C2EF